MSHAEAQHSAAGSDSVNSPMLVISVFDGSCRSIATSFRLPVEPHLRVGQVVVVDQDQIGLGLTGQLRQDRALARDVRLHPPAPDQPGPGPVVQADRDPVGAQHRMARRSRLHHREVREPALVIELVLRP